jgi:hypothetical protein
VCRTLLIHALTDDDKSFPYAPDPVEFDEHDGECLCQLDSETKTGKEQREALAEQLRPFLRAVSWGKIVIGVH